MSQNVWPPYVRGRSQNLRGPHRALTTDEQLEIRRLFKEATAERTRGRTARVLAARYGVSIRTIWRYCRYEPIPAGQEFLRSRLREWARQRDITLTTDDLVSLLFVIASHRDRREADAAERAAA